MNKTIPNVIRVVAGLLVLLSRRLLTLYGRSYNESLAVLWRILHSTGILEWLKFVPQKQAFYF